MSEMVPHGMNPVAESRLPSDRPATCLGRVRVRTHRSERPDCYGVEVRAGGVTPSVYKSFRM